MSKTPGIRVNILRNLLLYVSARTSIHKRLIIHKNINNRHMENFKHIESLGFIIKKEKIANLETEHNFSELILEDVDPYPGFYDHYHVPMNENEQKPRSLFAVIKNNSLDQMDDFIRTTGNIKDETKLEFDAIMGFLELQNNTVGCIRINMDEYEPLSEIIHQYSNRGFEFLANRSIKPYISLISLRKYIIMDEISDRIYKDSEMANTHYIKVDKHLEWEQFEKISIMIRNNWQHKIYDAAQAGVYNREGITELIRIYDRDTNIELLKYLKEKYDIEISRI